MQPLGEGPDEPVPGVMPQIVIDGLEPVEIEEEGRYRTLAAGHKPLVKMRQQRPSIAQASEVVVLGKIAKLTLGGDPPLELSEKGRDRLQRSELSRGPLPVAELDEAQDSGGQIAGHQRSRGHRGGRDVPSLFDGLLILLGGGFGTKHPGCLLVFRHGEDRVGALEIDQA